MSGDPYAHTYIDCNPNYNFNSGDCDTYTYPHRNRISFMRRQSRRSLLPRRARRWSGRERVDRRVWRIEFAGDVGRYEPRHGRDRGRVLWRVRDGWYRRVYAVHRSAWNAEHHGTGLDRSCGILCWVRHEQCEHPGVQFRAVSWDATWWRAARACERDGTRPLCFPWCGSGRLGGPRDHG